MMLKVSISTIKISGLILLFLTGCATGLKSSGPHPHESIRSWKQTWSSQLEGFISDLNISADGSSILFASVPDTEAEVPGPQAPMLTLLDQLGQQKWRSTTSPVRTQTVSDDGNLLLISTHGDRLLAKDAAGKELWSVQATCRPYILPSQKILCYHDEDAGSELAFEIMDLNGKKLLSFPVSRDVLVLKLSRDRQNILLGLTHGELILVGPDFKTRWKRSISGEIVDVAVADGNNPTAAVLYDPIRKTSIPAQRSMALLDSTGKSIAEQGLESRMEQIEFTHDSNLLLYGSLSTTAVVAQYSPNLETKKFLKQWDRKAETYANYSARLLMSQNYAIVGFDDIENPERHSHIRVFDFRGQLLWDIPLLSEEGSYLYVQDFSERTKTLIIGMDDGSVKNFRLE